MLKINLQESAPVAFEMIVEGSSSTVDQAWVVLESAAGYEVRIPAKHENNQIRCTIPPLKGILENGTTTAHLEVVVDGRFFRPLSEEVQLGTGKQTISIISKPTTEAKKPSTFSQFGTPPKEKKSSHQKEVAKKSKEYWDKQPEPDINDEMVGTARRVKPSSTEATAGNSFKESFEALEKLKSQQPVMSNIAEETGFTKKIEEKLAAQKRAHEARLAEARKIASTLFSGLNTESGKDLDTLKKLLK
jgi:hypothetical protein